MSGFSIGDVFGKTFLSAETIIGGRSTKKVFNATMTNLSVDGTSVPNTGFKQIIAGELVNGKAAGPNGWAYRKIGAVHGKSNKVSGGKLSSSNANEFFKWSNGTTTGDDKMILYPDDAFNFHPAKGTTAKFKFRYVTNKTSSGSKQSSPYDYVVNIKKESVSIPTAANSSSYPTITGYTKQNASSSASGYADFTMEFDGDQDNDYWSIDMSSRSGSIGQSNFETDGKRFLRVGSKSPESQDIDRVEITLLSIVKNPVSGCKDPDASNYNSNATIDDGSCSFTIASINDFKINKSSMTVGESAKISWELSSGNFSEIQLLQDGTNIMPAGLKTAQNSDTEVSPAVGDHKYQLKVLWNKPNVTPKTSSEKNLNVQSAASYVQCTDPNRNKNANGECASCKSGYYLDSATDLCSQCNDPLRQKKSNGECGDCISGYSEKNGQCAKEGCTTDGDYNFDPEAVVHNESMCGGTPATGGNGGTGGTGDGTGGGQTGGQTGGTGGTGGTDGTGDGELIEVLPDENGDAISSQVEPEEADLSKWILPGIGVLAVGAIILMR